MLDLYHIDDQQQTQIRKTYEVACERLADMQRQRDELDAAISDLQEQMSWAEKIMQADENPKQAAE